MKNKSLVPQEILQGIPRSPVSNRAEERIQETYRLLSGQEKPRRSHRRVWISSLSAVAACFLLLFGTNAAFPAFAEGLPVIGGFFQHINRHNTPYQQSLSSVKTHQGTGAGDYAQPIDLSVQSGDYSLTAEKAFCDGERLMIYLRMTIPEEEAASIEYLAAEDFHITVNGSSVSQVGKAKWGIFNPAEEPGNFVSAILLQLREPAADGEVQQVALKMANIKGKNISEKSYRNNPIPLEGAVFELSFETVADTSGNAEFDCKAEDGGITLNYVEFTPIRSGLNVTVPAWGVTNPNLYLMDGTRIPYNSSDESYQHVADKDGFTNDAIFDSVPAGTEQVILRIEQALNHDPTAEIVAEFTIDLKNGTATPSRTWEEDGVLAKNGPFDYSVLQSYVVEEGKPEGYVFYDETLMENDLLIGNIDYSAEHSMFSLDVYHAISPYREIKAEILNADGAVVAEELSSDNSICGNAYKTWYFDEKCSYWDRRLQNNPTNTHYEYHFALSSEYRPAFGETLTVRLSDPETGEILTTADRTMIYKYY